MLSITVLPCVPRFWLCRGLSSLAWASYVAIFINVLFSCGVVQATALVDQARFAPQKSSPSLPQKDVLVVGSEQDYPPFATGMTDETAGGFTVDLWKAVAAEMGLKYTIRVLPFRQILQEFKEGRIDVLINFAQSEERNRFADFTVPHVVVHGAIFVRKGESGIRTEDDLAQKSIIVINADLAHDYAVSKGWKTQLVLVDTAAEGMRLLSSGQHDAMLIGKLAGMQTLQELGLKNIEALKIEVGFKQKFAFAVQKGQSGLLGKLNEGLALTKSDGTYDALYDKWFGIYETKGIGLHDLLTYIIPVVAVLLGAAAYLFHRRRTERIRNELALKESESRFRTMANAAPVHIWTADKDKSATWFNLTALAFTGLSLEQAVGQGWIETMHPDDVQRSYEKFADHFDRRKPFSIEFRLRRHDGQYRWILDSGSPRFDEEGNFVGYIGLAIDINDRVGAEEMLRTLSTAIEQSPVSIVITDIDANIQYVNPRFEMETGYTSREVIGKNPRLLKSGLTSGEIYLDLWAKLTKGEVWQGELINKRKNGEIYWEEVHISPVKNDAGMQAYYVSAQVDISQRKQSEKNLRESEDRFRFMLENSPIAVRIANLATDQVVFANQRYAELIDSVRDKVLGVNPRQYYANTKEYSDIVERLGKGERVTNRLVELLIPGDHSETKWVLASYMQLEYQNEQAILGWFYDISDRKAIEEQVRQLAHYDQLTGLPNRSLFSDRLQQALAIAKRDDAHMAIMFIDLDKFKPINDTLGHDVGDLLLGEVAQRIQRCLRESDTVARIGGDEFIVLLPRIEGERDASRLAEKIRHALNQPFELAGRSLSVSSSTGIALYPEHGSEKDELIKNADIAMYHAKAGGRDSVRTYRPSMHGTGI